MFTEEKMTSNKRLEVLLNKDFQQEKPIKNYKQKHLSNFDKSEL
jgi:hypothetical protein